jgi:hypothetical protein
MLIVALPKELETLETFTDMTGTDESRPGLPRPMLCRTGVPVKGSGSRLLPSTLQQSTCCSTENMHATSHAYNEYHKKLEWTTPLTIFYNYAACRQMLYTLIPSRRLCACRPASVYSLDLENQRLI